MGESKAFAESFNNMLGIKESFEMPDRLMEIMMDNAAKERLFDSLLILGVDLDHDFMRDYFQAEHGDRDKLKQDYTPDCVCEIVSRLSGGESVVSDICAGTGALTVWKHAKNPQARFKCDELSSRAIPVLLLNLSIRDISAFVRQVDVLNGKVIKSWDLAATGRYSDITEAENCETDTDSVITNPPYSLKWTEAGEYTDDPRFRDFGIPPTKAADFAFILDALSRVKDGGAVIAILPHGVLFRGQKEADIRKKLVDGNYIETIIGLPEKLFANTGIPVLIMVLRKGREDSGIYFIDSSQNFIPGPKQNDMSTEQIERVMSAVTLRKSINKFSYLATIEEIRKNDYNLNIPRYVDTFEPEPVPDLAVLADEICQIDYEIEEAKIELFGMLKELTASDPEIEATHKNAVKKLETTIKKPTKPKPKKEPEPATYQQMTFDFLENENEF